MRINISSRVFHDGSRQKTLIEKLSEKWPTLYTHLCMCIILYVIARVYAFYNPYAIHTRLLRITCLIDDMKSQWIGFKRISHYIQCFWLYYTKRPGVDDSTSIYYIVGIKLVTNNCLNTNTNVYTYIYMYNLGIVSPWGSPYWKNYIDPCFNII